MRTGPYTAVILLSDLVFPKTSISLSEFLTASLFHPALHTLYRTTSPGVQDADHADLGAQVFAIDGDLEQGLSAGGEQQVVEQTRVFQGQHVEFVGHSEHNMEVAGGQEFAFASRQPALARLRLEAVK